MSYEVRQRVVEKSRPAAKGFSKQRKVWDVLYNGETVRTFKRRDWAVREIDRRNKRKELLASAGEEAKASGEPVTIRRRGQAPITVSYLPT